MTSDLKIYLVRNKEGKYYRRTGYQGYGPHWVDDIQKAALWSKPGPARSRITWFKKNYQGFPTCELIVISGGTVTVLEEEERVTRAIKKQEEARVRQKIRDNEYRAEVLKKAIEKDTQELTKLKGI